MSLTAIVLAAGRARRMGGAKHLRPVEGEPMLAHVIAAVRPAVDALVCVLRPGDRTGAALLAELDVPVAWAEPADEGRAASVRAGVRAADPGDDLLFALADQPFLRREDFARLVAARRELGVGIVHASYAGQRGSPVLFAARYRDELLALRGSQGGRSLIAAHPEAAVGVELDPERGRDIDRPEDLPGFLDGGTAAGTLRPAMQRTLSIIKPDAVEKGFTGAILAMIEGAGLRLLGLRMLRLSQEQAEAFYAVHAERPFYKSLVEFMTSGPVVVSALEGEDAITRYRELMGATNPEEAAEGTIRKRYATNIERNAVHGSDAPETAAAEVEFFFPGL